MSRSKKRAAIPGLVVYQRGKKWAYRLELERHPLTGERQWQYQSGFLTEVEAWSAAVKTKTAADEGRRVTPSRRTVATFLEEWLTAIQNSVKPTTYVNYVDYRDAYVLPTIGKRRLRDIDVPTLNALYRHLLSAGRCKPDNNSVMYEYWRARRQAGADPTPTEITLNCTVSIYAARHAVLRYRRGRIPVAKPRGLAPKTVKNVHRMLHRAFSDAVAWQYLSQNPAVHASLPRQRRQRRAKTGATWTAEQLTTWLRIAVRDRDAALWVLVATTGMRRSELAGAMLDLLDLDNKTLTLEDTRVVVDGKAEDSDGKTDSSFGRPVSLDAVTVAYLRRHVAMLAEERKDFGTGYNDHGKLFCHPDGRLIHPDTITRRFNRLVDLSGVPRIRLHDVRHTYATVALDNGEDLKVVSDRLGHANMNVTAQIYTHRSAGRDRDAADRVAGLIFGEDWEVPSDPDEG